MAILHVKAAILNDKAAILNVKAVILYVKAAILVFHSINGFLSLQLKLRLELGLRLRLTNGHVQTISFLISRKESVSYFQIDNNSSLSVSILHLNKIVNFSVFLSHCTFMYIIQIID